MNGDRPAAQRCGPPDGGTGAGDVPLEEPPGGGGEGVAAGERTARAALTRIAEPGDALLGGWLERYGAVETLAALGADRCLPGASARRWAGLRLRVEGARADSAGPERDLARIAELGGRFLCPGDREWPGQLDDLGEARPIGLWIRGGPSLRYCAVRSVAVVGARACTHYGAHVAAVLGAGLAERGWTVVSGAAYGVDAAAHRGSLAGGGATVAVLACGVDVPYPSGHRELLAGVAEQGLVVAELPPGLRPTRSRFVQRNRVIAALTRGTVVVEAAVRSGSLVTARRARALGRCVCGVPGPVTSGLSAGVHELLRDEAVLVTDADEVVELVGHIGELAPQRDGPVVERDLLEPEAAQVLEAVPVHTVATVQRIAWGSAVGEDRVRAHLLALHSLGFVARVGTRWRLARSPDRHSIR